MSHIDLTTDKPEITTKNPALEPLEVLLGDWDVELSNAEFLEGGAVLTGMMTFAWLEPAFISMGSHVTGGIVPDSISVIGRNDTGAAFTMLYYDDRGVSRVYDMSFDGKEWLLSRNDPGFQQRFAATITEDARTIRGSWERSHESDIWIHDFDVLYTRR